MAGIDFTLLSRSRHAVLAARLKPPDQYDDLNEFTDGWVHSPEASACYWAVWGGSEVKYGGQPTADLASPEWRAELTRVLTHWVVELHADGFLIDAPPELLVVPHGANRLLSNGEYASVIRSVIVEP